MTFSPNKLFLDLHDVNVANDFVGGLDKVIQGTVDNTEITKESNKVTGKSMINKIR